MAKQKAKKPKFSDFYKKGEVHPDYQRVIQEHAEKKGKIGVFAIHGGVIDPGTEELVHYVADKTQASKYVFSSKGEGGTEEPFDKTHHVTSTKISHTSSNKLKDIMEHCGTGFSTHTHHKEGKHAKRIYVGGDYEHLKKHVGEELQQKLDEHGYEVVVYDPNNGEYPKDITGTSKDREKGIHNFINKLGKQGGVQIELPKQLMENEQHRQIVGDVLAEIVDNLYQAKEPLDFEKGKAKYKKRYKKQEEYQIAA